MSIAFVQQKTAADAGAAGSTTSITATLTTPATTGNLLVAALALDKNGGTITVPTGFTLLNSYSGASVSGAMAYKRAAGGEAAIQWSWATLQRGAMWVGEYSGIVATPADPLDAKAEGTESDTATLTRSTGTTAATAQAVELAIAMMAVDTGSDTIRSWSNSFTERAWVADPSAVSGGHPGLSVGEKILSATGTIETTYTGNVSDQKYATLATFKAAEIGANLLWRLQADGML